MTTAQPPESRIGEYLALAVGIGLVSGGVLNWLTGGANLHTTILVLIGAGALSGYVRARQRRLGKAKK
jgi:hypothetical protein